MNVIVKIILTLLLTTFTAGGLSRATVQEPSCGDTTHRVEAIQMKIEDDPELDFYLDYKDGKYVKEADAVLTYGDSGTVELGYFVELEIKRVESNVISMKFEITHQTIEGWQSAGAGTENIMRIPTIRQRFIESSRRIRFVDDEWVDLFPEESYESTEFPVIRLKISATEQARVDNPD